MAVGTEGCLARTEKEVERLKSRRKATAKSLEHLCDWFVVYRGQLRSGQVRSCFSMPDHNHRSAELCETRSPHGQGEVTIMAKEIGPTGDATVPVMEVDQIAIADLA